MRFYESASKLICLRVLELLCFSTLMFLSLYDCMFVCMTSIIFSFVLIILCSRDCTLANSKFLYFLCRYACTFIFVCLYVCRFRMLVSSNDFMFVIFFKYYIFRVFFRCSGFLRFSSSQFSSSYLIINLPLRFSFFLVAMWQETNSARGNQNNV